jgi:ribonuclease HII
MRRQSASASLLPEAIDIFAQRIDACGSLFLPAKERPAQDTMPTMMQFEYEAWCNGFTRVAGVDEAGRGPLAGPIVAAAVVLSTPIPGLNDSKQLTSAQRNQLYEALLDGHHTIGVAVIPADHIDRHGIQSANYAAMAQAATALHPAADFLLVDGVLIHGCGLPQKRLIKGDCRSASIAAASIVAKVTRDRLMDEFDRLYPDYGFARHKGYATREHLEILGRLGPCPIHRRSFAPLSRATAAGQLFES